MHGWIAGWTCQFLLLLCTDILIIIIILLLLKKQVSEEMSNVYYICYYKESLPLHFQCADMSLRGRVFVIRQRSMIYGRK